MSSSSSSPTPVPSVPPELVPGGKVKDLRALLARAHAEASEGEVEAAAAEAFGDLLDEIVLAMCFDVHRAVKTGVFSLVEVQAEQGGRASGGGAAAGAPTDIFGQVITTAVGVPTLKKQPECVCPNCQRNMAATRFAPHLEKCMGMGRNSSRLASRRLANSSKDPGCYRESGGQEDEDDAEDEDWIAESSHHHPRGAGGLYGSGAHSGGGGVGGNSGHGRRKRDKNSPRRRGIKTNAKTSGETTPQEGSITPPTSFDQLTLEERSQWLSSICGVVGLNSRKICSRSTRCPVHTDAQRREVRIRWLAPMAAAVDVAGAAGEDGHIDIDSFTEGDTAALRESLAQLSRASSPAESVISTSSCGGGRGRREKGRRGKKKAGSKSGSRGSTPPLMHID